MMVPKLNLYILIFNKHTLTHDIVSLNDNKLLPPSLNIDNKNYSSLEEMLSSLFETYVDVSGSFVRYKLCDAHLTDIGLILSYFCVIPFGTKIKNSFLVPTKDYENYTKNLSNIIRLL